MVSILEMYIFRFVSIYVAHGSRQRCMKMQGSMQFLLSSNLRRNVQTMQIISPDC